jgi:hypothetical protein
MTAQQGFQYEKNAADLLKKYNLVPKNFVPAGAGHNQPDLLLEYRKVKAGCELKITAASAGSLVLKYDPNNKTMPWGFGTIRQDEDEKKFLAEAAKSCGFFDDVKKLWVPKGIPQKFRDKPTIPDKRKQYEADLKTFTDIKKEIDASFIENYYQKKDTYYVNVGTHGFYLFGPKNPLKLKGVPRFNASAKVIYRGRVQYKGSGNYQFTFELQFSMKSKSPFNIAPVDGKTVNIIKSNLKLECFP